MDSDKKPEEQEAVYTTIVGGRPPGCGTQVGNIPRGIEVLVKKASVDPDFRLLLLTKRAEAAKEIDLGLSQPEIDMLNSTPVKQLEKIIENTKVPTQHKRVFLHKAGKAMLAVVLAGASVAMINSCDDRPVTKGIQPDKIEKIQAENNINQGDANDANDPNSEKLKEDPPEVNNMPPISRGISPARN